MAYSKIWLYDELLASSLPDDPWVATALARYFPKALRERYAAYMQRHPLKREIIATHVTNSMVNRVGGTFVHRLLESTGAKPAEIVRAYLLNREVFGFVELWMAIEALDNKVDDAVQSAMLIETSRLITRGTTWFLRSRRLTEDMAATIAHFAPRIAALAKLLAQMQDDGERARIDAAVAKYVDQGVSQELATAVVSFDTLYAALDIIEVADCIQARRRNPSPGFTSSSRTSLGCRGCATGWPRCRMVRTGRCWRRKRCRTICPACSGRSPAEVLAGSSENAAQELLIAAWQDRNRRGIERAGQLLTELRSAGSVDSAMLSVALRELRGLA